ncbi:hypothetical protein ACIBU0_03075 [Streptomyces sp. NPDC049627]|uniref:hypothetical protein n=1 Tax=Streptomyces sp. NPDC049627 TaxID=3365595 RepID=UPI0037BB4D9C
MAVTHIDALEKQIRTLRTQQAVLRSVIRRNTTGRGLPYRIPGRTVGLRTPGHA